MRISDWSSDVCSSDLQVKKTAKKESSTITRKIACTTAAVVRRPTSSALPSTCMPWKQPEMAMIIPKTGAFTNPTYKSVIGTTSRNRWMKVMGGISHETEQRKHPPIIAITTEMKQKRGKNANK